MQEASGVKSLEDVTERFRAAAHGLSDGALVRDPNSAVADMMNAIEVGTKGIDSGLIPMDAKPEHLDCHDARDLCAIIDGMCMAEMSWLAGSTLLQTVYTSVHYHSPELAYRCSAPKPLQTILRAYSLAVAKSVELAHTELSKGHVKDIEDCWLETFGVAVKLNDWVEDVLRELKRARTLCREIQDPWSLELDRRLAVRSEYLKLLDHHHVDMAILRSPITTLPSKGVTTVAPRLRVTMPLPRGPESYTMFTSIVEGLANLKDLPGSFWKVATWGSAPSLVRSAYKSAMLSQPLSQEGIHSLFHQSFDSISAMRVLVPGYKHETFDMWLHSLRSDAIEMLCAPLHNPARQKRVYDKLVSDWAVQASFIEQFRPDSIRRLTLRLHAIRLDCLLESAILALDLDLINKAEAAEHYWWIYSVCSARLNLASGADDWWIQYVTAWGLIAAGMIQRTIGQSATPSFRRFAQRHKWALKPSTGLRPSFEAWCRTRERIQESRGIDESSFDKALVHLDRFSAIEKSSRTANFHHAIIDLRTKVLNRFTTSE